MKNFTAIYMAPAATIAEWMEKPEEERKAEEQKMKGEWDAWLAVHKDAVLNTIALGKTKKVTSAGVEDTKNDMMLSSYVAADSLEAAAELFKDHPHFGISGATIEIMETRQM
ncbi:MAG: hypothetical protein KGI78_02265 [Patescibacteria group bacterium]|nr:hypothetical protein [Patescibacteria group bacterium]MDE1944524.1 hypothetical protein [Patescibacteria group bacterium]MDE1945365.1 hypothetical protein [Patescibacteria group bacterium]MDE2057658.1 hypothetical protein [Patescibacteria group bacterium]